MADSDQHVVEAAHETRRLGIRPGWLGTCCRMLLDDDATLSKELRQPLAGFDGDQPFARSFVEYRP